MTALIWLDLETTGLIPKRDAILEIAIARSSLSDPFNLEHVFHRVYPLSPRDGELLNPVVREMHTKNGLLGECIAEWEKVCASGLAQFQVDTLPNRTLLEANIIPVVEDYKDKPILAGSSVHFDHDFLREHAPDVAHLFHHRHFDVSVIKLFCQSLGMEKPLRQEAHRAKADIIESALHGHICTKWLEGWGHLTVTNRMLSSIR